MRILFVDDDDSRGFVWRTWLEDAGHTVVRAATGLDALTDSRPFDVALVDVHLPDIGGTDVCSVLKQRDRSARVVLFSALFTSPHEQAEGLRGGADRYLAAPIDKSTVLRAVASFTPAAEASSLDA